MSRRTAAAALVTLTLVVTGCIVDTPAIENTQTASPTAVQAAPTAETQFAPTAISAPPTPAATPTAIPKPEPTTTPEITATPELTATPEPDPVDAPAPLPTALPEDNFAPTTIDAGPVSIPISGTSFVLDAARPVLQLGGHTLIYLDDDQLAEVDIFTPVADRNGRILPTYDDTIAYLSSDERFGEVEELAPVTIAGLPTRVFGATTNVESADAERAFVTDVTALKDAVLGWYPPKRYQLWVIDRPAGTLIVSAESLDNPGQFDEALSLATEILSTLTIG